MKSPFSAPRFLVAMLSDPPKAEPKPEPLPCIKMTMIRRIAEIIWMISMMFIVDG